jgi:phosphoglycolate phosphatase-like HAD superfamily hydrolase
MSTRDAAALSDFKPRHGFFVGIDSDGCAFDSMEIKQKECFCPNTIKYWRLQAVSKYARETWEFVNLYSKWRGTNRWPALVMTFDLLEKRPEVAERRAKVPRLPAVRAFLKSGQPQSNEGLEAYRAEHAEPELDLALEWSLAVNKSIAWMVSGLPPFPYVRESLIALETKADSMVVSQTPTEALEREWAEHDIAKYVRAIAGQEMGTKKQHLKMATAGKYAPGHVLMIGDAFGDLEAARENSALFFPINPGHEEESWKRFHDEGIAKFLAGEYAGAYQAELLAEFAKLLPEVPPWHQKK